MRANAFLTICTLSVSALTFSAPLSWGQSAKYDGPRPPKPDVPYLLHATNLVETETLEAREGDSKKAHVASVPGKTSPVQTPLAEPIFLFDSVKVQPDRLKLYKMDQTRDGRREVTFPDNPRKGPKPVNLTVKRLSGSLYRVEADDVLENGEYCLSPEGSSTVHCFEIY